MKKLIRIKAVLFLLVCAVSAHAQVDPHFSQYYAYPLWLNPALTGVMDGDLRLTGNYKEQWTGVGNGYKTAAVSTDFRTSDKVALGVNVFNQSAGSAGYNYLAAYGSFGYQIALSNNGYHRLNFGLQVGVINRSFDPNKLQFDSQYNPGIGYDPTMPNFENFTNSNATVFDASAGMFYYNGTPTSSANVFAGISVAHLAPSNDPFATDGTKSRIPMRYNAHAGIRIRTADFLDVTPHALYIRQQQNQIRAAGLNLEFRLKPETSLILGGMYRLEDAAVANLGLHLKSLLIGLSYDYTTSPLKSTVGRQQGVYELSISYIFKHRLLGLEPVCPRL